MDNKVIFLYPGQGSQHVGMGLDLYQSYPEAQELFEQADGLLGFSLSRLCFEGPEKELCQDLNAQLAVYTVSCILTRILKVNNLHPDVASGYSSGFYAAAYAAGCFDFADGLGIVRTAGKILLDEGSKIDGGMAVIFGLSPDKVKDICRKTGNVDIAIMNTPRQIVVSGISSSVNKVKKRSLRDGALDAYNIPAATAYHSLFMKECGARLSMELKNEVLENPHIPLYSYLYLEPVPNGGELIRIMGDQLSRPVLWVDLIKKLNKNLKGSFLEIGPGDVIYRTVRWIDRNIEIMNISSRKKIVTLTFF